MTEVPEHLIKRAAEARAKAEANKDSRTAEEYIDILATLPDLDVTLNALVHLPEKIRLELEKRARADKAELRGLQIRRVELKEDIEETDRCINALEAKIEEHNAKLRALASSDLESSVHLLVEQFKDFI